MTLIGKAPDGTSEASARRGQHEGGTSQAAALQGRQTEAATLPSKLFFRIGEVAEVVGVEPHVLRYWEREFRSVRPTKSAKGQRVYSRRDVESLLRVRDLLYREGFTIAGARKKLQRRAGAEREDDGENEAPATQASSKSRDQLLAMRDEVEAFLAELG